MCKKIFVLYSINMHNYEKLVDGDHSTLFLADLVHIMAPCVGASGTRNALHMDYLQLFTN